MIKIETTKSFLGFGDGTRRGECFYSEGMHYKRGGIKPGWEIREGMSTTSNKAIYISETMGRGNTIKVGEAVLLNLNPHHKPIDVFATPVFQGVANPNIEIAVKLYDFKRILFRTGITNSTSTILNQLRVDGSLRSAISGQYVIN